MIVTVWSVRGAPGTSTLALGLARARAAVQRPALLVEADAAGGVLAVRAGVPASPGLVELAAAHREAPGQSLDAGCRPLADNLQVLTAPPVASQAAAALQAVGAGLPGMLASSAQTVVVDGGRLSSAGHTGALLEAADVVLVAARPSLVEITAVLPVLTEQFERGRLAGLVLIDATAHRGEPAADPREVFETLSGRCALTAVLPYDPAGVRAMYRADSGRQLRRRPLGRALAELAERVSALAGEARTDPGEQAVPRTPPPSRVEPLSADVLEVHR
jgi:MinD-like ATPase involved in chromosome partitioning or flagellar assembly